MQVAIDGPSGAGKSSLARALAQRLQIRYIDTGAMYRALAFQAISKGVDLADERAVTDLLDGIDIELHWDAGGQQRATVDGVDISGEIRSPEVSQGASRIAEHAAVRKAMVTAQQALATEGDVVMDGRDIGSAVLPGADIKFYVTADVKTRAARRIAQMQEKDANAVNLDLDTVAAELEARDEADSQREATPLVRLPEAVLVDTSGESLEESVALMLGEMEKRGLIPSESPRDDVETLDARESAKRETKTPAVKQILEGVEKDAQGRAKVGKVFYFFWVLVRGFCRLFFLLKITGEEHVKENQGGYIIVANHVGYKDPVLLAVCLHQKMFFMAKIELFKNKLFAWLITTLGAFSISRNAYDTASIRNAIRVVQGGGALMVFPEGQRNKTGELLPFEKGVAFMAQSAKAQVIPAYISPKRVGGRYRVNIGRAMDVVELASGLPKKERTDAITHMLEEAVAGLKREQEGMTGRKK